MNISKLFLLTSCIITPSLHAMDDSHEVRWQESWLARPIRSPQSTKTMVHDLIQDHAEEIIKKDMITVPEYHASECRPAHSKKLLDLYKTHNPTSKNYENAKKWVIADAALSFVMDKTLAENVSELLTEHSPISFKKDNASDKELLWNIAALAISGEHLELKKQSDALITQNQIPQPDRTFMTYLLCYIIAHKKEQVGQEMWETCLEKGAKLEGIRKDRDFAPWCVGLMQSNEEQQKEYRSYNCYYLPPMNHIMPLDCAVRSANVPAIKWLKSKQLEILTDQKQNPLWLNYLKECAGTNTSRYSEHSSYVLKDKMRECIWGILQANPNLELDQETAESVCGTYLSIYHISDDEKVAYIERRARSQTSWSYDSLSFIPRTFSLILEGGDAITRAEQRARESQSNPPANLNGDATNNV